MTPTISIAGDGASRARQALEGCVAEGGVVIFPADTLYGLGCDPSSPAAIQRIHSLKGRDERKPSAVMFFAPLAMRELLSTLGPRTREALGALLPGAVTLVVHNPQRLYPLACGDHPERLGIRLIEGALAGTVSAIFQTSANRSGEPAPTRFEELDAGILGRRPGDRRRRARRRALDRGRSDGARLGRLLERPAGGGGEHGSDPRQPARACRARRQPAVPSRAASTVAKTSTRIASPSRIAHTSTTSCSVSIPVVRPRAINLVGTITRPLSVPEFARLKANLVHRVVEGVEVAANPLVAAVGVGLGGELGGRCDLELRVDERQQRLHAALAQRLEAPANELHVLARHRPKGRRARAAIAAAMVAAP